MATPGTYPALQTRKGRKGGSRVPIQHLSAVEHALRSMMPMSMILTQLSAQWSKPRQYVMRVVQQVEAQWATDADLVKDYRRHQMREGLETLYRQAMQNNKYTVAAYVMNLLCKLDGCYAADKVDVTMTGAVGVGISLGSLGLKTPEEVQTRIEELRAQLAAKGPGALQGIQPSQVAVAQLAASPAPNGVNPSTVIDIASPEDPDPQGGGA